jgi:hypothetical protein
VVENGIDTLDRSLRIQILKDKGMEIYAPTAAEKAAFKSAAQKPIIEYFEGRIARAWNDKLLNAVKVAEGELQK